MSDDNPRATQVYNTQNDEQQIHEVISELQASQNVNAFFVLSKFLDCPEIKNEPEFCQILFSEHLQVIEELIEWMLLPKLVIKKKKINPSKTNVDSYPYQCRQFMKDNWCFYEQMYIAARNNKLQFGIWFNFLRKEYFDKDTIYTALGYFSDVMIPFAKYEFSGSFNLTQSLQASTAKKNIQTLSIMKILPQDLIDQLIKYCHYDVIYSFLKTSILVSIQDPRDYEISRSALMKILKGAQIPNLFSNFPILTIEANEQVAKAMDYLQSMANAVKQLSQNIQLNSQSIFRTTAMISVAVQSKIIKYIIDQLVQSRLCGLQGKQKQRERMHSSASNANQLSTSGEIHQLSCSMGTSQALLPLSVSVNVYNLSPLPEIGTSAPLVDGDQEELVQTLFKILSGYVQVFVRIPRTLNLIDNQFFENHQQSQFQLGQLKMNQIIAQTVSSLTTVPRTSKQKTKQFTYGEYLAMTTEFRQQMQYLLDNMETLTKFVYNQTESGQGNAFSKVVPFASGQNVKAISLMKYEYFKLIHNVLIMIQCKQPDTQTPHNTTQNEKVKQKQGKDIVQSKQSKQLRQTKQSAKQQKQINLQSPQKIEKQTKQQSSPKVVYKQPPRLSIRRLKSITVKPFDFKIQKLLIIEIIKKYLTDNRWNNIAHHLLEKITHSLIMCSYSYIKKNIQKDKIRKFSDSFLAFLIENFTKRDFVFLNTVKFTTQGNLHSLYNIAKDLAYTLNSTNQLIIFLSQFQPWKKFIMDDLKTYEQKAFPDASKPQQYDKNQGETYNKLKVDEADSIKKLIQNISLTKKWPTRNKNKNMSKSGVFQFRNSGDAFLKSETDEHLKRTIGNTATKTQKEHVGIEDLQDILKRKIEYSKKGSEIRQFDIEQISVRNNVNQYKKQRKSFDPNGPKIQFKSQEDILANKKVDKQPSKQTTKSAQTAQ